jgi:hypothetical protein
MVSAILFARRMGEDYKLQCIREDGQHQGCSHAWPRRDCDGIVSHVRLLLSLFVLARLFYGESAVESTFQRSSKHSQDVAKCEAAEPY